MGKGKDRIEEMFVFVADDETGEGVVAFGSELGMMPMVAADSTRLAELRRIAKAISAHKKQPIKVLRFTTRTQLEVIDERRPT